MAAKQRMMQTITQAAIMTVKEEENLVNATRSVQVMPRISGITFGWKAAHNTRNYKL